MADTTRQPVTVLLERMSSGDRAAEAELFSVVFGELRGMAAARLRSLSPGDTLRPTELVNEAYIRLACGADGWKGRAHFFGAAGRAMRHILVDRARRRSSVKRGGDLRRARLDVAGDCEVGDPDDLQRVLEIEEALRTLERDHPLAARVTELRFFVGLSNEEVAEALGRSLRTVYREWSFAKAWLRRELSRDSVGE